MPPFLVTRNQTQIVIAIHECAATYKRLLYIIINYYLVSHSVWSNDLCYMSLGAEGSGVQIQSSIPRYGIQTRLFHPFEGSKLVVWENAGLDSRHTGSLVHPGSVLRFGCG